MAGMLCIAVAVLLVGCGGDNEGGGDSQPDDGGRIGYVELDQQGEACLNKWNEPRNADAQVMAASSYQNTYTAVSFYEPVDSSNDCVALIAYPGYDDAAQFVSTAGTYESFPSITGQINEVVTEPLPWNAFLDSDGMAQPRIEDGVPFDGIEPDAQMCVDSWNQDFAAPGTVSNASGISGRADVGTDTQFPNRCLITVEFSDPVRGDFVTQWRDGSELGSSEWNLISDGSSAVIVDVYEPVAASVTPDGQIALAPDELDRASGNADSQSADMRFHSEDSPNSDTTIPSSPSLSSKPAILAETGGCDSIVFPRSASAVIDIETEGIDCHRGISVVMDWMTNAPSSKGGPTDWDCSIESSAGSQLDSYKYSCERGDDALSFTASGLCGSGIESSGLGCTEF